MNPRSAVFDIQRVDNDEPVTDSDLVAVEEPLEIRLDYLDGRSRRQKSIAITMRTPGNDHELAIGFLFSEGIIARAEEVKRVAHCSLNSPATRPGNAVRVELADETRVDLVRLERHFYTSSSCGVCGKTSIDALRVESRFLPALEHSRFSISRRRLLELPGSLVRKQQVFDETGGLHAAGLFDRRGDVVSGREDVGRHNALDKLIGRLFLDRQLPAADFGVVVSGRTSFELMQKVVMAGCPLLAAVGAPSSLAIDMAREFGVTLVGFLRDGRFNIYSGAHRITP